MKKSSISLIRVILTEDDSLTDSETLALEALATGMRSADISQYQPMTVVGYARSRGISRTVVHEALRQLKISSERRRMIGGKLSPEVVAALDAMRHG